MAHRWDPTRPPVTGLAHPIPLDPMGIDGPTRGQARGLAWRRSSRGRYLPTDVPEEPVEQRIIEVAARLPEYGAITGWAALRLAGATFHDGLARDGRTRLPVPVAVGPRGGMRGDDVGVSFESLPESEVVSLQGVRVTHPIRATFDAIRAASDEHEAIVALEMAMIARLVTAEQVVAYSSTRFRARRKHLVRVAASRAGPFSRSPTEVRLRLRCENETCTGPLLVNPVLETADGDRLGEVDLLDPVAGLVIDYDGAEHRGVLRHSQDVLKDERLRDHAIEVLRVTSLQARSPALPERVQATRQRARFVPEEERTWRIRPSGPRRPLRHPWND